MGVKYAATGPKALDFADKFKSLGLEFDLAGGDDFSFTLGHTAKRCEELCSTMESMLQMQQIETKELEKLHGRLVWYGSYVFGRELNTAVQVLSRASRKPCKKYNMDEELYKALKFLIASVKDTGPITISTAQTQTWFIFTDGAFEPGAEHPGTSVGLLVDQWGRSIEFFGLAVPQTLLDQFLEESDHPIYELELLPVIVAVGQRSYCARTLFFI